MTLILADRHHPQRDRLEAMIRATFLAEYGAHVRRLPDRLMAALGPDGAPRAVAGLRFAADGLFSESYLVDPAESVLSRAIGRPVARERIVEISNLAAPRAGAAVPLIIAAVRYAHAAGADVGLFTATARLRALLRRTHLAAVDLGPARPERLANPAAWGSYYLHDPRVMAAPAETLPAAWMPSLQPLEARRHA